jgi:hypothetical protein
MELRVAKYFNDGRGFETLPARKKRSRGSLPLGGHEVEFTCLNPQWRPPENNLCLFHALSIVLRHRSNSPRNPARWTRGDPAPPLPYLLREPNLDQRRSRDVAFVGGDLHLLQQADGNAQRNRRRLGCKLGNRTRLARRQSRSAVESSRFPSGRAHRLRS